MKILLYSWYFFRSVFLRGFFNTIRLMRAEVVNEKKFRIKTSTIKKSESKEFFHYQGSSYLVLQRILSELHKTTKDFDFVDIGCGKGRAVFVAEYYGYNHLTGIELDGHLVQEAKRNIELYPFKREESSINFVEENAVDYVYKDKPTVYFLFNPFNEKILSKVLDQIIALSSSETFFIYMNPLYPLPFKEKGIEVEKTYKTRFYKEAIVFKMKQRKM